MISVVIPTYNRADRIKRSIESVLGQDYQDLEVIVVDDGSTDETREVIENMEDPRIFYIKNERRLGANAARNIGIQRAGGEYIAFQDSDDVWRKDKLKKQIDMFMGNDDLDIVYSRYLRHYKNGEKAIVPDERCTSEQLQEKLMSTLAAGNVIGTPTMIAKKKCFDEQGMFDLAVQRFQDWEINIKFVQYYKYGFIDEVLVDAYVSSDSITKVKSAWESVLFIVKKHQKFFEYQGTLNKHLAYLVNPAAEEKEIEKLFQCLGQELFLQAVYANTEMNIKKYEVMQKNYIFTKEWIKRQKADCLANSFFSDYSENSVVLYGFGEIGKLFLNTLTDESKSKIRYVIDRNTFAAAEYRIVPLEGLEKDDWGGVRCIIITAIAYEEEIRQELKKLTTSPVISVYDVIGSGLC